MTVFFLFFCEVATAVWPREFYHRNFSSGKIHVAIPWFLPRKKTHTQSSDSPSFGLSYGAFAIVFSSLVTLLRLIHRDSRSVWELTRRRP